MMLAGLAERFEEGRVCVTKKRNANIVFRIGQISLFDMCLPEKEGII